MTTNTKWNTASLLKGPIQEPSGFFPFKAHKVAISLKYGIAR